MSARVGYVTDRPLAITRRQLEVLELRAQGLTAREISERLWLSEYTVLEHVQEINRRLGARNSTHAVTIGFRSGLLS